MSSNLSNFINFMCSVVLYHIVFSLKNFNGLENHKGAFC